MTTQPEDLIRYPVKVIACLRPGYLTVFVEYGLGLADGGIPDTIPIDLVPPDLWMPNSEFTVVLDRISDRFVGIERTTDDGPLSNGLVGAAGE